MVLDFLVFFFLSFDLSSFSSFFAFSSFSSGASSTATGLTSSLSLTKGIDKCFILTFHVNAKLYIIHDLEIFPALRSEDMKDSLYWQPQSTLVRHSLYQMWLVVSNGSVRKRRENLLVFNV